MNTLRLTEAITQNRVKENKDIFSLLDINPEFLKILPGFDAHAIRMGEYSAKYFIRTKEIVESIADQDQEVTMQVFQKTPGAAVCGVEIVENLIKFAAGEYEDEEKARAKYEEYLELKDYEKERRENALEDGENMYEAMKAYKAMVRCKQQLDAMWKPALDKIEVEIIKKDGEMVDAFKPVIKIKGPYKYFARLESIYLGILARATKVMTNTRKVVDAANGKTVLFFADRFDMFSTQQLDGYAAFKGGVQGVATDAQGRVMNNLGLGTMPHALIAIFGGNTPEATLAFARKYPEVDTISLVDFHNNCPATAVEVAQYLKDNGEELNGVRLDTSGSMVDEGILFELGILEQYFTEKEAKQIRNEYMINKRNKVVINNSVFSVPTRAKLKKAGLTGVNPVGVRLVREKLDTAGFPNVKIFVSGGFDADKITKFEDEKVPVDGYGVGSSLLAPKYVSGNGDFTADIVALNGESVAKIGRMEF